MLTFHLPIGQLFNALQSGATAVLELHQVHRDQNFESVLPMSDGRSRHIAGVEIHKSKVSKGLQAVDFRVAAMVDLLSGPRKLSRPSCKYRLLFANDFCMFWEVDRMYPAF
jgi:hypothetical protein